MARVSVKMFATVREAAGTSSALFEAQDIDDLLRGLGRFYGPRLGKLLKDFSSDPDTLVILLNGRNMSRRSSNKVLLVDGDEVAIFPPVSGG